MTILTAMGKLAELGIAKQKPPPPPTIQHIIAEKDRLMQLTALLW